MMPVAVEPGNERSNWVFKDVPGLVLVSRTVTPPPVPIYWVLNIYVTVGGAPATPAWQLSDGDQVVYVPDSAGGAGNHYQGSVFTNLLKGTGKRYFEQIISGGVEPSLASQFGYGLASTDFTLTGAANTLSSTGSWGFRQDGAMGAEYVGDDGAVGLTTVTGLSAPLTGDVIMFAVDIDGKKMWVGRNGTWFTGDPSTNTTPTQPVLRGTSLTTYTPAFAAQRGLTGSTLRTIPTDFLYPIPTGFTYWAAA